MTDTFPFYMDESGFTGEDLMSSAQPIFVQASSTLADNRCRKLYSEFFKGVQAPELKHSRLAQRDAGRNRIVNFIKAIHQHERAHFATWLAHKEFCLLTYLIDGWVEWAAYHDGVDLYEDGGHLALANMSYYCLRAFQSPQFLRNHLLRFQTMMMKRTAASYRAFWRTMYADLPKVDEHTRYILVFFVGSEAKLGFSHLLRMPKRTISPALTGTVLTCSHWRRATALPLVLIHDRSSHLGKDRKIRELITSSKIDPMTYGIGERAIRFPLDVSATKFEDSRNHLQLQFCDLLAGASAAWARQFIEVEHDKHYCAALGDAGIEDFKIGMIWPEPEVDPEAIGMLGWSGRFLESLTDQTRKLDRSKDNF